MSDEKKLERPTASSESDQEEDESSKQSKTSEGTFSSTFHEESQRDAEYIAAKNFTLAGSCFVPELLPCSQSDYSSDHSDYSWPTESSQLKCSTCERIKSQSSAEQNSETLQELLSDDQQRTTDESASFIRSETLQESLPGDQQRCTKGSHPFIRSETLQESLPDDSQQRSPNASRSFAQSLFPDEIRSTDTPIPCHLLSPERRALLEQQRYEQFFEKYISFLQPETMQESLSDAHQTSTGASGPFGRPETFQESSPQSQPRHQPEAEEFPLYYIFLVLFQLYVLIDPTYFHSISTLSGLSIPPMFFQGEYLPSAPIWFLVISGFWLAIFALLYIL